MQCFDGKPGGKDPGVAMILLSKDPIFHSVVVFHWSSDMMNKGGKAHRIVPASSAPATDESFESYHDGSNK